MQAVSVCWPWACVSQDRPVLSVRLPGLRSELSVSWGHLSPVSCNLHRKPEQPGFQPYHCGPEQTLCHVWISLSFSVCKSEGSDLVGKAVHWMPFLQFSIAGKMPWCWGRSSSWVGGGELAVQELSPTSCFCRPVLFYPPFGCSIFIHPPSVCGCLFSPMMPPVFPADWPSGRPDGWISLEWESSGCHPLGFTPLRVSAVWDERKSEAWSVYLFL